MPLSKATIRAVQTFCLSIIFIATLLLFYVIGPDMETKYWPVVGKMNILRMEPEDEKSTRLWASFEKRRSCTYIGISWFHGQPDGIFDRVPMALLRDPNDVSSPNRPVGFQRGGPWIVSVPIGEIRTNSFARLYHQCWPFWVSTTEFFP